MYLSTAFWKLLSVGRGYHRLGLRVLNRQTIATIVVFWVFSTYLTIRQKNGYIASRLSLTQGLRFNVVSLLLRYTLTKPSKNSKHTPTNSSILSVGSVHFYHSPWTATSTSPTPLLQTPLKIQQLAILLPLALACSFRTVHSYLVLWQPLPTASYLSKWPLANSIGPLLMVRRKRNLEPQSS